MSEHQPVVRLALLHFGVREVLGLNVCTLSHTDGSAVSYQEPVDQQQGGTCRTASTDHLAPATRVDAD